MSIRVVRETSSIISSMPYPLHVGRDLYFLQNTLTGQIKIGSSNNVEKRFAELERACGIPLVLLRVLDGEGDDEAEMHDAFASERRIGEWFTPHALILAFVKTDLPPESLLADRWRELADAEGEL